MRHTQLRSFHAVAQRLSFTAAARELGVSQPTITTQVKSLEDEFGVELFVRHGRRIGLPETARCLLDLTRSPIPDGTEGARSPNETRAHRTADAKSGPPEPEPVPAMSWAATSRRPRHPVPVTT
ncbi:MAG: LysR family transcriptional regulator, partial [Reyranella sp.]|nr:LysR family transcriptional regulator [Reyranella sp.]